MRGRERRDGEKGGRDSERRKRGYIEDEREGESSDKRKSGRRGRDRE